MRGFVANLGLSAGAVVLTLLVLEAAVRLVDPYPYFAQWEINRSEYGNLSEYDSVLGWRGTASARATMVTANSRIVVKHNAWGFRDDEPDARARGKPQVVFLGDSYTWGYEVAARDMFVNILRARLSGLEIFNLAHKGYGTDQELLTYLRWGAHLAPTLVLLIFVENDLADNVSRVRYRKPKPRFEVDHDTLVLTNVPVPWSPRWSLPPEALQPPTSLRARLHDALLRAQLLHIVDTAIRSWGNRPVVQPPPDERQRDVTARLLERLRTEARRSGSQLIVVAAPSKAQMVLGRKYTPYQLWLGQECERLGIRYIDLGPYFERARGRTYFRDGRHWNARGNRVAALALLGAVNWAAHSGAAHSARESSGATVGGREPRRTPAEGGRARGGR